ncbi:hypothetical protein F2Q68_00042193 [Brassica cretica]|uniref:Uncharacterized protein n=1 Tax=Brassica cretica TaxID=69181 RepID=A0A8S9MCK1_BRACR|nr:hypothetical protein F2Q68_00042193 [Brassica cretica]
MVISPIIFPDFNFGRVLQQWHFSKVHNCPPSEYVQTSPEKGLDVTRSNYLFKLTDSYYVQIVALSNTNTELPGEPTSPEVRHAGWVWSQRSFFSGPVIHSPPLNETTTAAQAIVGDSSVTEPHFAVAEELLKLGFRVRAGVGSAQRAVSIVQRKEEALIASSLNYAVSDSFTKPGGLERSTDAFKETHNLSQALDDTLFGGCSKRGRLRSVGKSCSSSRFRDETVFVEVAETIHPIPTEGFRFGNSDQLMLLHNTNTESQVSLRKEIVSDRASSRYLGDCLLQCDAVKMSSLATACAAVSFLFDSFDEDSSVKPTDSGLSVFCKPDRLFVKATSGTNFYFDHEFVTSQSYLKKVSSSKEGSIIPMVNKSHIFQRT